MGERLEVAVEMLEMARTELERGRKMKEPLFIRNAADKAFLAVVESVNDLAKSRIGVVPLKHTDRRKFLRDIGRDDLRAEYSDLMKDLHEDCFYTGVIDDRELDAAFRKAGHFIDKIKDITSS